MCVEWACLWARRRAKHQNKDTRPSARLIFRGQLWGQNSFINRIFFGVASQVQLDEEKNKEQKKNQMGHKRDEKLT